MDACFNPEDPDAKQTLSKKRTTRDIQKKSKDEDKSRSSWFGSNSEKKRISSPKWSDKNHESDNDGSDVDYQRMLSVCFKLIMSVTAVAVVCLIVFMARTNVWQDGEETTTTRHIAVAIIAMVFAVAFMIHGSNREHHSHWMIGSFGVVDRIGDRITAAGISACGSFAFVCTILFATLPVSATDSCL
jgi:hypothetical protein